MRAFKEMSGTPKSRCCVRQGRTWDRRRGAGPIGDGGLVVVVGVHARPRRTGKPSTGQRGPGDQAFERQEVCIMQNAGTVLDVLHERGRRGLPLDELYRQMFNPQFI